MTLPPNPRDWPAEYRHRYDERAGIIEYVGGLPRRTAEREAERMVREDVRREARTPREVR